MTTTATRHLLGSLGTDGAGSHTAYCACGWTSAPHPTPTGAHRDADDHQAEVDAFARALAYSDSVGLSDGTDRPATTAAEASS
jgi:hypothetical protein